MVFLRCLFLTTREISDEEVPSLSETDIEPTQIRFESIIQPHAGLDVCMIIPSRSLTSASLTPTSERSRINSIANDEAEVIINSSINDLAIL